MFAKLLKYEWKSGMRVIGVLSLGVLGLGVLATIMLRIMVFCGSHAESDLSAVIMIMLTTALVFMCVALGVYGVAVQILLLYRYYRHKFTDEGYLTFTLPVRSRQLFLSSYVNILLWTLISGAVVAVTVSFAALFGPVENGLVNTEMFAEIGEVMRFVSAVFLKSGNGLYYGMAFLQMVVVLISTPVISMTCVTVGAVVAKKHKILTAFGMYYAFSALMGMASTVITFLAAILVGDNGQVFLLAGNGIQALLTLGAAVGGYFLSVHLMDHKLNLP